MAEPNTEAELDSFRRRWREEVSARSKPRASPNGPPQSSTSAAGRPPGRDPPTPAKAPIKEEEDAEVEGRTYHDLEDTEQYLSLENEEKRLEGLPPREPRSALEHYEKAVERETTGSLGDSVGLYRKAFKLDSAVQEKYKQKHFPQAWAPTSKASNLNPSNASATVPSTAHHSLDASTTTLPELVQAFSQLSIPGAPPETDLSPPPPCPISRIPEEILSEILRHVSTDDVASFSRLAQSCKRLAFLIMTDDRIWRQIALSSDFGVRAMHFQYACDYHGEPLNDFSRRPSAPIQLDLTPSVYPTYRSQFRRRPRIRFNGCYISNVNYPRQGGASQSQFTWSNPVHIVTYYRYLRFFKDGSCISLQTTTEPAETVHHLTKDNVHRHHTGTLPSAVMKDALLGRWRLSGTERIPAIEADEVELSKGPGECTVEPSDFHHLEDEGDIYIETEGVNSKYLFRMVFGFSSAGPKDSTRNNKLKWKGFWSYNRLADDWGEFALKHDKAFQWARVKSYTT